MRIEQCKDADLLGRMKHAVTSQIERIREGGEIEEEGMLYDLKQELFKLDLRLVELAG